MSLKKQTFSGLVWTFTDAFLLKGLSFVASLILARLLGPKEFGLFGMIVVFIAIGTSLVDSGLSASLIRTKDADDRDFSTVFFINLVVSLIIYVVLFLAAPIIAEFFKQATLISVIRIYCLSFIVSAFSSVQTALLNKNMQFKKIMQLNIPGVLLGVIIGVSLGYLGYGVWSIVWMYLSTQIIQSVMLWIFSDWKPSFIFDKERMQYHYVFGYKLMISGLIDTVFNNVYNILIGKFFTVQSLGYYERAKLFNDYPVTTLTQIINKVSYPLLAQLHGQKERISSVYKQLLKFTFFVTAPLMMGAAAITRPLFLLVLGNQWLPAVPFFQILCFSGMFYPIHAFNISVLKVYGRSDLFLKLEIIKKILIIISILVSFSFGIYGLVWSSVFTSFAALIINTHYSSNMIDYSTKKQIGDMLPVLLKAGLMAAIMYGFIILLKDKSTFVQIGISSFIGGGFYFLVNYLLREKMLFLVLKFIKQKRL